MDMKLFLIVAMAGLMLCSCAKPDVILKEDVKAPTAVTDPAGPGDSSLPGKIPVEYNQETPLICSAESEEEAKQIADQYGIQLVEFSYGVASFYTEEDPAEVIRRGLEVGWTELSLNQIHPID